MQSNNSFCIIILSWFLIHVATSTGKGPVGIYAIDSRYAIVADSEHNGLFVVDLVYGGVVGKRLWPGVRESPELWKSMTGVASCPTCNFIYASSTKNPQLWRVDLPVPLAQMAKAHDFSILSTAPLIQIPFKGFQKTRMVAITKDGLKGFISDYDKGCWVFNPRESTPAMQLYVAKRDIHGEGASGTMLSADETILYITTASSIFAAQVRGDKVPRKLKKIDVTQICKLKKSAHFRETVALEDGSLIAVGKADHHEGSQVFMLNPSQDKSSFTCHLIAGSGSYGWRDGHGSLAKFTRPHQMVRRPNTSDVLLTDIDNRAIRVVKFQGAERGYVSTVLYDGGLYAELWGQNNVHIAPPPTYEVFAPSASRLSFQDAQDKCKQDGFDLCSLATLRESRNALSDDSRVGENQTSVWTNSGCSSCWLKEPGVCPRQNICESDHVLKLQNSSWGCDSRVLAIMKGHGESFEMQTICTPGGENENGLKSSLLCCGRFPGDRQ